ncbi:serine threonine-phosphatase 2A activator [Micractinium conductrix]|uniref:Serine/threonine-protein phosphatase 2A activator n=1 Tax=Micractinium conductrix TaxID=554055 RepID=A0A2P6VIK1_9CHLO|nr:serine threonine-phosphatase 2A activator [Micractinium conductrix]|eukprot:PSC73914.1 serine threonine-phosphatase 2A activator [Micractinium conductrix]
MPPTAAPWARQAAGGGAPGAPLPAVSRGELTRAPWAAASGPALTGRPVEAAMPHAVPRLPAPLGGNAGAVAAGAAAPSVPLGHTFVPPTKRIHSPEQLKAFLRSDTARGFVSFILALNEAVKGRQLSDKCEVSEAVQRLLRLLDTLWRWVEETPPAAHTLRYGNPAYRTWFARMAEAAPQLTAEVLPAGLEGAAVELAGYLSDSFGNATRIDYGTGHETTFCALLYCLARLGVVGAADAAALVTRVFARYLELMRKIQTTYWLEPAGSHGVWGLDDYQFLPFIWGSAQLIDHPFIKPASIHTHEVLEGYGGEYLYLGCIRFVMQVKKGPLQETSPMLCDIAGIPLWSKVNSGMVKMYQAEVLSKFPIMQHFLFGSLLQFQPAGSGGGAGGGGAAAASNGGGGASEPPAAAANT